jgi:hypothetical protein
MESKWRNFLQAIPKRRDFAEGRAASPAINAPGRQASKIHFVFPKCRSSRRSEHCQGGGGGRRGGTTLTSAAEPYNASGKHEAHMAGSNCCPDFAATAGPSAYASRMGNRMETSFRTLFGTRFPSSRLPTQGDRRPLLFRCPSRVQPATGYCPSPVRSASSETHKLA